MTYECPKCGSKGPHRLITRGPHYTLVCGNCDRYIKHIKKSELDRLEKGVIQLHTNNSEPENINDCVVVNEDGEIL